MSEVVLLLRSQPCHNVPSSCSMPLVLLPPPQSGECPISMEPFASADVDFLPAGCRVDPSRPDLCAARLPCGHVCGAMPLLYHLACSTMRCPCCRGGLDAPLDLSCLPPHIRGPFIRQTRRMRREELDSSQSDDAARIVQLLWEDFEEGRSNSSSFREDLWAGISTTMIPVEVSIYLTRTEEVRGSSSSPLLPDRNDSLGPGRRLLEMMPTHPRHQQRTGGREAAVISDDHFDSLFLLPWLGIQGVPAITAGVLPVDTINLMGLNRSRRTTVPGGLPHPRSPSSVADALVMGRRSAANTHFLRCGMVSVPGSGTMYLMDQWGIDQINQWRAAHPTDSLRFSVHTRSVITNEAVCLCNTFPFVLDPLEGEDHVVPGSGMDNWFEIRTREVQELSSPSRFVIHSILWNTASTVLRRLIVI